MTEGGRKEREREREREVHRLGFVLYGLGAPDTADNLHTRLPCASLSMCS